MENKITIVSNLKGGCGKSTVCLAMANWLAWRGEPVAVIDADIQQTLSRARKAELSERPEAAVPWQVASLNIMDAAGIRAAVGRLRAIPGHVLVDCPGNLSDPGMRPLLEEAGLVVTPFSFDRFTLDSTGLFVSVLRQLTQAPVVFVPNRIVVAEGSTDYRARRDESLRVLGRLGTVTPRIKQSVVMSRLSTLLPLDTYQRNAVQYAFEAIFGKLPQSQ